MITATALTALAAHPHWVGGGAPWLFFLIPLFWIVVLGVIFAFVGRRWRRAAWSNGYGPHAAHWATTSGARSAEAVLADRFANGDIEEQEYRARLEVLRANQQPPMPPRG
ncbi:SHOCT domain-containing protein [Schumannella sp. 10F1B-5-1]|uniref:SHOCT domain-containing protein n=1 Tax=Schumannella sp. 10F1B-5-1 TaxID=2590780 RepID=UPI00113170F1|nr:hypothetical protein [Schumannella sp. 10F1B-5-1]TPW70821.1 hypothetical protein FJ658_11915 [Schumannella sp. 10F1B-5-1]